MEQINKDIDGILDAPQPSHPTAEVLLSKKIERKKYICFVYIYCKLIENFILLSHEMKRNIRFPSHLFAHSAARRPKCFRGWKKRKTSWSRK